MSEDNKEQAPTTYELLCQVESGIVEDLLFGAYLRSLKTGDSEETTEDIDEWSDYTFALGRAYHAIWPKGATSCTSAVLLMQPAVDALLKVVQPLADEHSIATTGESANDVAVAEYFRYNVEAIKKRFVK